MTSSVGSLDMDFLTRIWKACQGDDGLAEFTRKNSTKGKASKDSPDEVYKTIGKGFRIYFPSHETVTSSTAGYAGTICIQSKYYDNSKFPRQLMRDCKSVRPRVLMHNKILFVRPDSGDNSWAYIGSANCSESAWGNKLVKDKITKQPKLNCRNWECGVLIPANSKLDSQGYKAKSPREPGGSTLESSDGSLPSSTLQVFDGVIPVPMQYPGEEYDGRKPWYFQEHG